MKLVVVLFIVALALIIVLTQVKLSKPVILVLDDGETNFVDGVKAFLEDHRLRYEIVVVRIDVEEDKLEANLSRYRNNYAVGPRLSSEAHKLIPILEKYKIFSVAPLVTSYLVIGKSPYLMSLSVTDEEQGKQIAQFLQNVGCEKTLLICDEHNPIHSQSIEESLRKYLSKGLFKTAWISRVDELVDEDFSLYDSIVFAVDGRMAGMLAQLARAKGFSGTLVGSDYAFTTDLIQIGKNAVEGMYVCSLFDYSTMIEKNFLDLQTSGAYDAAMLIAELLKNKIPTENAAEHLRGRTFIGVTGEFTVEPSLSVKRELMFVKVEKQSFQIER